MVRCYGGILLVDAIFPVFRRGSQLADDSKIAPSTAETARNKLPVIPSEQASIVAESVDRTSTNLKSDGCPKLALFAASAKLERRIMCRFGNWKNSRTTFLSSCLLALHSRYGDKTLGITAE